MQLHYPQNSKEGAIINTYAKDAWKYYEYGRQYNNSLVPNQYTMVNTNQEFFIGNQWLHMPDNEAMRRLAKPTFNIIKRVTSLFVASLTSSNTTVNFEPLSYQDDAEAAAFATAEVRNLLEKFKLDYRIRDALFDGAITGDYAAHFFWNPEARPYGGAFGEYKGEIEMEMLDGINVMFGNPNCNEVEKQPYILIVGRDTVENLKREALAWRRRKRAEATVLAESALHQPADSSQPRTDSSVRVNSFEAQIGTRREKANCAETGAAHAGSALSALSVGYSPDNPVAEGANHIPDAAAAHVPAAQSGINSGLASSSLARTDASERGTHLSPRNLLGTDYAGSLQNRGSLFFNPGAGSKNEGKRRLREAGYSDYEDENIIINPDADFTNFSGIGGRTELRGNDDKTGKALYVYLYTKVWKEESYVNHKTGMVETRMVQTVHVTKATRECNIFEDIDTGLTRYPIAWGNWQKQKNQYHGRALVTEIIPNQIFINQMMAMVFRHLQTQAFPTKLYNADLLPGLSNEVGTAIGVRNLLPGQSLGEVISTVPASNMSAQIIQAIDLCMAYTKECLGATDAQMGNVSPDNTSALMVLQNASEVPLENTRAGLHEWVEDIGAILLDMMGTYYGMRPVVHEREVQVPVLGADGQQLPDPLTNQPAFMPETKKVAEQFDFSVFKRLWLNISVDVGATTYYSEIAMVQTLDNLRHDGTLSVIDYLERMPDKLISRKQELIDALRKQEGGQNDLAAANNDFTGVSPALSGELDAARKIAELPTSMQARYDALPKVAQRALVK